MAMDPRFHPRRSPDDRPHPRPPMRPGSTPMRPGTTPVHPGATPVRSGSETLPPTSVRLRDGEREIEVSGSPGFVRQILDDLPALIARLRGERAPTPASIRMPSLAPAPEPSPPAPEAADGDEPATAGHAGIPAPKRSGAEDGASRSGAAQGHSPSGAGASLEDRVLAALRSATHPMPVATIRGRLGGGVSAQQVRRILERAGSRVVATGDRPIRYRLR